MSLRRVAGRLSEADTESLVSDFQSGITLTELGENYGFHRTTVAAFLKKRGVFAGRQRVLPESQIDEAVALYERGLTVNAAAERVGSNYGTVYRALRRRGVALRLGPRSAPRDPRR